MAEPAQLFAFPSPWAARQAARAARGAGLQACRRAGRLAVWGHPLAAQAPLGLLIWFGTRGIRGAVHYSCSWDERGWRSWLRSGNLNPRPYSAPSRRRIPNRRRSR